MMNKIELLAYIKKKYTDMEWDLSVQEYKELYTSIGDLEEESQEDTLERTTLDNSDLRVVQEWYKIIKYLNKEFGGHTPEIDRIVAEKINQVMVETISQM